jgi:hypothetical protein
MNCVIIPRHCCVIVEHESDCDSRGDEVEVISVDESRSDASVSEV